MLPSQAVNRVMELAATSALGTDGGVRGSRVGTVAPSESRDGLAPSRGQSKQMGGDLIYREVKDRTAVVALDVPKVSEGKRWSAVG